MSRYTRSVLKTPSNFKPNTKKRRRYESQGFLKGSSFYSPAYAVAGAIRNALNPDNAHKRSGECRSLKDMSDEELAALEAQYGCKIVGEF